MATGVSPPAIGELRAKIKEEVTDYLQAKVEELLAEGIEKVSLVGVEGRGTGGDHRAGKKNNSQLGSDVYSRSIRHRSLGSG